MVQPSIAERASSNESSPTRMAWKELSPRLRSRRGRNGRWAVPMKPCSPKAQEVDGFCKGLDDNDDSVDEEPAQLHPSSPSNTAETSTTEEDASQQDMQSFPSTPSNAAEVSNADEVLLLASHLKGVHFEETVMTYEVTPYSEIYGLHPREFDFDKNYAMVPAQGFGEYRQVLNGEHCVDNSSSDDIGAMDSDDEDDDDWDEVYYAQGGCLIVE
mmetsp:Transcript_73949/g.176003  ORF Transcript_73949/g.176003 Transcript_73949/m.176003 type:complete len:214 (-) Transcript_73949:99-740(-)|eukprot:CAMPEP_0178414264 /NCGR_PEP_ID=MMETSP0689_2-20121128/22948_1 /TAXON_ID=160604 /ORGANISM="Amphidinium massartii, Strain CS-259" /LENGTH=213 /DNA_ID=CAMNT_0020035551 /DNA_START=70 /DNA_END=711 /DNA_ORIENTATION=+